MNFYQWILNVTLKLFFMKLKLPVVFFVKHFEIKANIWLHLKLLCLVFGLKHTNFSENNIDGI